MSGSQTGPTAAPSPRSTAGGEVVERRIEDGVAILTFNRPERMNAWTPELGERYFDLLEECAAAADVRAIVVTGAGRGFCVGTDMEVLQAVGDAAETPDDAAVTQARQQTLPLSIPKPIVAAVNGACAGLGLVMALMCDIRFAAAGAKFTTAFARRGLVAEHGMSWVLPRLVGHARALDLLLSGRVFLAEEAAELGVVNRVVNPDAVLDEALAYARDLAENCSPASLAVMKHQVYAHWELDCESALEESNRLMVESLSRPDLAEGVQSFLEGRPPRFPPL